MDEQTTTETAAPGAATPAADSAATPATPAGGEPTFYNGETEEQLRARGLTKTGSLLNPQL